MNEITQGRLIVPPTDEKLKQRLALKLKEYQERITGKGKPWEYMHPELAHFTCVGYRDAYYKAFVLERVLNSNEPVDAWKLCLELRAQWKGAFNIDDFKIACGVIDKYCGNLLGQPFLDRGTGLPELPKPE